MTGLIARYADAWNDHDAAACAACFLPGGRRIRCVRRAADAPGRPGPPRVEGRDAIAAAIGGLMSCVTDLGLDVEALSEGSDDRIWTEWRLTGTHAADRGRRDARGEPLDLLGVSIFRLASGGIREERVYWDSLATVGSPGAPLTA